MMYYEPKVMHIIKYKLNIFCERLSRTIIKQEKSRMKYVNDNRTMLQTIAVENTINANQICCK